MLKAFALAAAAGCAGISANHGALAEPVPTHGALVGDVTARSAVFWSRADREAVMHVEVDARGERGISAEAQASADQDFTGKVKVAGLRPGKTYAYRLWFTEPGNGRHKRRGKDVEGRFRTPAEAGDKEAVTFSFGGDVAGQNVCRDSVEGFPIFKAITREKPDFFIGLGDMIYADNLCNPTGLYNNAQVPGDFIQSADLDNFRKHWKYNRAEANFQALARSTSYYGLWDDHEVVNDFGPLHDTRATAPYTAGQRLMPLGMRVFLEYNPILPGSDTPNRLYRKARWGKHLELFILDNRQYRESNLELNSETGLPETNETERTKTMLGREQKTWLMDGLKKSKATWKIIVTSVPLSIPTGSPVALSGRDGWADYDRPNEGFEAELLEILKSSHARKDNLLFITTDVHFSEVFRYTPFGDAWTFHEVVSGPLNAGIFPNRAFDTSLGAESIFFFGPPAPVTTWEEAKRWFNFGQVEIDREGDLTAKIITTDGGVAYTLDLTVP